MAIAIRIMKKTKRKAMCWVCDECDRKSRYVSCVGIDDTGAEVAVAHLAGEAGWEEATEPARTPTGRMRRNRLTTKHYCPKCMKKPAVNQIPMGTTTTCPR